MEPQKFSTAQRPSRQPTRNASCPNSGFIWSPSSSTEKPRLAARFIQTKMFVSQRSSDAAALRAIQQAKLHQVRLVDFLECVLFFAHRRSDRAQTRRAAGIFLNDRQKQVAVHFVQSMIVHAQHR